MQQQKAKAPRRPLSPFLLRAVLSSPIKMKVLAGACGWPAYSLFYAQIRLREVVATKLTTDRLMRLADLLDFDRREVFLDGLAVPEKIESKNETVATTEAVGR
jgi:hypothetical protein